LNISNGINLTGEVTISRENILTGEKEECFRTHNTITISGSQWILMKMFGLHLDSIHDPSIPYEDIGQDTSVVIPDLNDDNQLKIGRDPKGDPSVEPFNGYTPITDEIPSEHFIRGFLVGNGGSGEDAISTKNTDYSFIKLRNPIPFQQTTSDQGLDPSISDKYLGIYRQPGGSDKSYYIKKFDGKAHIYHNWWRDGQRWDYIDPVTQDDLGPGAKNTPKTNRIETYAQVDMSIDAKNDDCIGYFKHAGNNQDAAINELGLVAFDTVPGARSIIDMLYQYKIKRLITLIYDNDRAATADDEVKALASEIVTVMTEQLGTTIEQANIAAFLSIVSDISTASTIDYSEYQEQLSAVDENQQPLNIGVQAFYNQNQTFQYTTDHFLEYMSSSEFASLSTDEAQRIKMITYYTFNSIPLQENWRILISYRIYAN